MGRGKGVHAVFGTQGIGDLQSVSPQFAEQVLNCVNTLIAHRVNDQSSAEMVAAWSGSRDDLNVAAQITADRNTGAGYLNAALEGGDVHVFLIALHNVVQARGGISKLGERTHKSRTTLYKALSVNGNPHIESTNQILGVIGINLKVVAKNSKRKGRSMTTVV